MWALPTESPLAPEVVDAAVDVVPPRPPGGSHRLPPSALEN
jgi:hypothetical protein